MFSIERFKSTILLSLYSSVMEFLRVQMLNSFIKPFLNTCLWKNPVPYAQRTIGSTEIDGMWSLSLKVLLLASPLTDMSP